jgi:hypothetical protein
MFSPRDERYDHEINRNSTIMLKTGTNHHPGPPDVTIAMSDFISRYAFGSPSILLPKKITARE